jgi:hypothetical protein
MHEVGQVLYRRFYRWPTSDSLVKGLVQKLIGFAK